MSRPIQTKMDRRTALAALASVGSTVACSSPSPTVSPPEVESQEWHLRYAPRIEFLADTLTIDQRLDLFAQHGYRAFEYNELPRRHTLEGAQGIRDKMDALGMEMGVFVVNSGSWNGNALVDPAFHSKFLDDVRTALEYHKVMRNRCSTVTSGLSVDYLPLERQTQNLIDGLKKAVEILDGSDLTLILEPLNVLVDHAGYHVVTSQQAADIVDAVGSPHLRILFDIYHQQISEGNLINNIEKHWDRIAYFQVGDVPGRMEPYTGEINYSNIFQRIYEKGYQGIVGMEHRLSEPGPEGLEKCFEAYHRADSWD